MAAFGETELSDIRRRLAVFCYQMLGSPFEAEDATQDAMERIWKARESFDPAKGAFAAWAFRIARNVCQDRLRDIGRRPLPHDVREPGLEVGAPLVPALDVPWLMPAPTGLWSTSEVEDQAESRETVRFAVTAMLQKLSPLQRGAFVLREVIGLTAVEAAQVLNTSVPAANSALQRARAALAAERRRASPDPATVERYARAIERADVAALASLVQDDIVLEMPPVPDWSVGVATYRAFMEHLFDWRGTRWSTRRISANGQPGLLLYRGNSEGWEPHTVQLFDGTTADRIGRVLVYQHPRLFELFERFPGMR